MGFSEETSAQLELIRQHLLADFASMETFMIPTPSQVHAPTRLKQSTLSQRRSCINVMIPPAEFNMGSAQVPVAAESCEERHYRGVRRRAWGKKRRSEEEEEEEKRGNSECKMVKREEELTAEAPKEVVPVTVPESETPSNCTGFGDSEDMNEIFGGPLLSPLSLQPWFGYSTLEVM
ncbi:hypothetical protein V6N13_096432 [Hibiscus sabdariffa]|uniref:Uncharacterized protein n=2 Tax=Hibiscus sabdariffa TaxID=183260 RepID=A0ABR2A9S4_9ROSI